MENLVVTTPAFLAVLTGLTAVGAICAARQWIRRRRLIAAGVTTLTVLCGLLVTADFFNAHYDYAPQVRDVADVAFPGFEYHTLSIADVTRGMRRPHDGVVNVALPNGGDGFGASHELVYVPKAYFSTSASLPVIYLLHGSPGSAEDWFRAAHAASVGGMLDALGEPAILVAPEMSGGWSQDSECVDGAKLQAESHLLNVVLPTTHRLLRVSDGRADSVIAGNSSGGYCALNIGLRHRDVFGTILDLSGYTHPTYDRGLGHLFGSGHDLPEVVKANSPDVYAATLPPGPPTRIWFDVGDDDRQSLRQLTSISSAFSAQSGVSTKLTVRPGGHTYDVWRPALRAATCWALQAPPRCLLDGSEE